MTSRPLAATAAATFILAAALSSVREGVVEEPEGEVPVLGAGDAHADA